MEINVFDFRLAGYAYLLEKFALAGMPNWHSSSVSTTRTHYSKIRDGVVEEVFRSQYWPSEKIGDHLEFALKYDGINLGLLARIFEKVSLEGLTEYIKSKPTGKYARRIWFFYEFLSGKQLPVDDLTSSNYIDAMVLSMILESIIVHYLNKKYWSCIAQVVLLKMPEQYLQNLDIYMLSLNYQPTAQSAKLYHIA